MGRASTGIGIVGWGGGEYQYPLAERWRLRAGLNVNHREYKGNRWDQTFLAGYVGPRWLITRNTEVSLLATASQRWWGGSSLNYDYGARLEVLHRVFAGLRLNGRAQWSDRKYQQQKFLEGPLMVFSLGANYVLFPTVQVNAAGRLSAAGYRVSPLEQCRVLDAGGDERCALPWGFTVGLSAEFRWTDFRAGGGSVHGCAPDPHPHAEPRDDGVRVQSPDRVFQPGARIQRATLRLQTQPRGNALGAAVLKSAPSLLCSGDLMRPSVSWRFFLAALRAD